MSCINNNKIHRQFRKTFPESFQKLFKSWVLWYTKGHQICALKHNLEEQWISKWQTQLLFILGSFTIFKMFTEYIPIFYNAAKQSAQKLLSKKTYLNPKILKHVYGISHFLLYFSTFQFTKYLKQIFIMIRNNKTLF